MKDTLEARRRKIVFTLAQVNRQIDATKKALKQIEARRIALSNPKKQAA